MIDLQGLPGPLGFFQLRQDEAEYVFTHRFTGDELRLSADVIHAEFSRRFHTGTFDPHSDGLSLTSMFLEFLPDLCTKCGCRLLPHEAALCEQCEAQTIAELQDIATS